jgi:hypothetical protein
MPELFERRIATPFKQLLCQLPIFRALFILTTCKKQIGNGGDAHYHIMKGLIIMFIQIPFLPQGRVTHAIVDKKAPQEFLKNLEKLKITPILSTEVATVNPCLSTHPDMQIFHAGSNKVVCEPSVYKYYSDMLTPLELEVVCGKTSLKSNYPNDIAYNIARVGSYALHKKSHTDMQILSIFTSNNVSIINVAQGYTKCAVCIVAKNAIITSDAGIAKTLKESDIEVLLIEAGDIALEGMDYGFIGGTGGLISPNLLAFCGNIEKHVDYCKIKSFAKKYDVDLVSLYSGKLVDIGSIIPIKQEVIYWNNSQ